VFVVHVTDTLSGLKDSAYVRIVEPIGVMAGAIAASAGALAAGNVPAGTQAVLPLSITNTNSGLLRIDSLKTITAFFIPAWDTTITLLGAGDTMSVAITFAPAAAVVYMDTLFVYSSSPMSPLKVPLSGNGSVTGVAAGSEIPAIYSLDQNYPNPFNPSTTIRFGLPVASRVRLTVHDILGREVARLADGIQKEGYVTVTWAPQAASGVYFVRMDATGIADDNQRFVEVRRMVLLK
jgi:hypothetical protein